MTTCDPYTVAENGIGSGRQLQEDDADPIVRRDTRK